jgi:signal transduction histidine kinase
MDDYKNITNYTVLYVEDEKQSVDLVKEILKDKVKNIFVAYDGEEGLSQYKKYLPDIVISDIQMPKMNGIELSKEIKKLNPKQNIILVTAFNENDLLLEAINLGINKYVIKPIVSMDSLLQPISDICKVLSYDKRVKKEQRIDAMEKILKTIAHHWRQPLNIISVEASSVKLDVELGEIEQQNLIEKLDHINCTTQELSEMIENFINMYSFTTQNQIKSFPIKDAFKAPLQKLNNQIKHNKIEIINQIEPYMIEQNQVLLEQVILYILQNSIDAFEENLNNITQRYIVIDLKQHNSSFILSIQDSAGGIDKQTLPNVFEPYFSGKKVHSGSGMGLYLAKKIIENQFDSSIELINQSFEIKGKKLYGVKVSFKID